MTMDLSARIEKAIAAEGTTVTKFTLHDFAEGQFPADGPYGDHDRSTLPRKGAVVRLSKKSVAIIRKEVRAGAETSHLKRSVVLLSSRRGAQHCPHSRRPSGCFS